ncbi:accessory factor UbiK family protein [Pleionea sp. CnH1-48]|uniref:accessory factor UbiK family protein n=1 Tax=Pleionea sp. CnH1-48 TaxID=2954494 RepID=UPI002096C12C|nr:accessory factor UbiK family protein [Pleionea sp. CnH1-48]MCO7227076.1 accessory factor UbiK family protein [Pleionea sp. CnH1-48]
MIDAKIIDDLAAKLSQITPPGVKTMHDEMQQQFRQVLQSSLAHLELVTREEFDVQTRVLQKTRAKLTELEATVAKLEKQLEQP